MFVGRGVNENTIGLHCSEHQTDRFEGGRISDEAGVLTDCSFRSVLLPHRRASVEILQ